ncbi:MAG: adenosylcobinamide-GDP ribazoletransferase [Hyphomicrobiaceae bacterium]
MRHLIVALQFMTRLPMPQIAEFRADDLSRAAPYVAWTGLVVGLFVGAAFAIGQFASAGVAGVIAVGVWIWVTGGLHLDGLADSADGLAASHRSPERFLEVARQPTSGAFAIVAVACVLVGKIALLADLARGSSSAVAMAGLALVPFWARWCATVAAHRLTPLDRGRGATFKSGLTARSIWIAGVVAGALSAVVAPILLVAGPLAALGALRFWRHKLNGFTGDTTGATIEATELLLLLALVAVPMSPLGALVLGHGSL